MKPGLLKCMGCIFVMIGLLAGGSGPIQSTAFAETGLVEIARSPRQWTGVAVSGERMFVNYPRWSENVPFSVGEVVSDTRVRPFPDNEWNRWDPSLDPSEHFICVQSVVVDADGFLWILDPANPRFQGVIPGGPKLIKVDLRTDAVVERYVFESPTIRPDSYLNDVRVDTKRQVAYISDSGAAALLVVDLQTGRSARRLENHPSTRSEGVVLTIGGRPWLRPDGTAPDVHVDGIALDRQGKYLYYQALTARSLYRIATRWLRDDRLPQNRLGEKVEYLAPAGASDGLLYGPDGRIVLSSLELSAVRAYALGRGVEVIVRDPSLAWPDSFALDPEGGIYVTTSQIHRSPDVPEPYKIFRIPPGVVLRQP